MTNTIHLRMPLRAVFVMLVAVLMSVSAWAQNLNLSIVDEIPNVITGLTSNWGENGSENYDKLVDGNINTKYGLGHELAQEPYVEFSYSEAFVPKGYVLWTGNDNSNGGRNPKSWVIKAKLNENDQWTTLASVDNTNGDKLPLTKTTKAEFTITNNNAYKYFRFEAVRGMNGDLAQFEMGELQFLVESDNGIPAEDIVDEDDVTLIGAIRSTGAQAFNTRYTHKANTRVEMDCIVQERGSGSWKALFGARLGNKDHNAFCFFSHHRGIALVSYNRSGNETDDWKSLPWERIFLTCEGQTSTWYKYYERAEAHNSQTTTGTADNGKNPMVLFNLNTSSTEGEVQLDNSPSYMTLYNCKIYEGDKLVCDFVPAIYQTKVGLYDRVRHIFGESITDSPFEIADKVFRVTEKPAVTTGTNSNSGSGNENYDKLVDGNLGTKYCIGASRTATVEFNYAKPIIPKGYDLWTANDCEGQRNPTSWTIKAKNAGDNDWTTLTTVDNSAGDKLPMANFAGRHFDIDNNNAYQYFRFEATNPGVFQLAELQLYAEAPKPDLVVNGVLDVSKITDDYTVKDGVKLTGTAGQEAHIVIEEGATVTLSNVDITTIHNNTNHQWGGLTCLGDATIILEEGTVNNVKGGFGGNPGIQIGPEGTTLTIKGKGTLNASAQPYEMNNNYGGAPGIGGVPFGTNGSIVIDGGIINAIGSKKAAGIGSGFWGTCEGVTINAGITKVTATCGDGAPEIIGKSGNSNGAPVTISQRLNDVTNDKTRTLEPCTSFNLNNRGDFTALDGDVMTGKAGANAHIVIEDGATVTLRDADITTISTSNNWAGITCLGDATIILEGENKVKGGNCQYPGIQAGAAGKTLTIRGDGSLEASTNINQTTLCGAAIGGVAQNTCGNIVISGGTITATGGFGAAAIGSGAKGTCGDITIDGGVITAQGGDCAPGIGCGSLAHCGNITLTDNIKSVTTYKGKDARAYLGFDYQATGGDINISSNINQELITDGCLYTPIVTYPVWVCGTQVTEKNVTNVLGDGTVSYTPGEGTGTLTFTASPTSTATNGGASIACYDGSLTINTPQNGLTLSNTILVPQGKVTVNGNLTIPSATFSIVCKDFAINGNLDLTSTGGGIVVTNGAITLNGTSHKVSCQSGDALAGSSAAVPISVKGDIIATAPQSAFFATDLTIEGNVEATSTTYLAINATGTVNMTGNATIEAGSNAINCPGNVTINGNLTAISTNGCGINSQGNVTINGNVSVTAQREGLHASVLTLNGTTHKVESKSSIALWATTVDITGDITAEAKYPAIQVSGTLTIDGDVTAKSTESVPALQCDGGINIVSGTWTLENNSANVPAIDGQGKINIPDGYEISEPAGGKLNASGTSIDKADGTPASRVVIRPHVHALDAVAAVAPSCTASGIAAYWQCKGCQKLFADENGENGITAPVEIPALGHNWGDWVVTREAEPGKPGEETRTCLNDPSHKETRALEYMLAVNETNFPDAAFRQYILEKHDTNGDQKLSDDEIAAVTMLSAYSLDIADLTGIEHFQKLTSLTVNNNKLTKLDVSKNILLEGLYFGENLITEIDLSKNTALTTLECSGNQLTALDLSNNKALTSVSCGNNRIHGEAMDALIASLPQTTDGFFCGFDPTEETEENVVTTTQVAQLKAKGWKSYRISENQGLWYEEYEGAHIHELEAVAAVSPTCTEPGHVAYWQCKGCQKLFADENGENEITAPEEIPALGHIWGEWVVTREAEPGKPGEETRTCLNDPSHKETRPIYSVEYTAPKAKENLVYTGEAQALIEPGTAEGGEMQYSLDGKTWSTDVPTATEAGDYTVYYKVVGDSDHKGIDAQSLIVTIAMPDSLKSLTIDADTDNWYDINGHKLSGKPTKKGLYIRNGHMVVIK